jgi:hypothetical protein
VIRCIDCRMSWSDADASERYLAHKPVCTTIAAAPSPQVVQQAADFLAHPSHGSTGKRVEVGENAVPGAPIREDGGAGRGVSSPGAAPIRPLFKWIGERNARPVRWWL